MKTLNSLSGSGRPVGRRGWELAVRRWSVAVGLAGLVTPAAAQEVYDYFPSVNPFSVPPTEDNRNLEALNPNQWPDRPQIIQAGEGSQLSRYNIKAGPVYMSFRAGVIFRYQSNFNLVSDDNPQGQQDDFRIGPAISVNLRYDISEQARLVINSGLTYQWSLNNNNNQLIFAPSSALDYQFSVGQVELSISDTVAVASTAVVDPTIAGTGDNSLTDFNRLNNNVRFGAEYPVFADTVLTSSYTFGIFRGLQNDNFNQLDRNAHTFALGAQYMINPVWTVGLASQGNIMTFIPDQFSVSTGGGVVNQRGQIQNNSHGWGVGPTAAWRITEFMTLSGVAQYTVQNFEQDGVIADTSNFEGMTFNLNLDHIINEYVTHGITGGRIFSPGNGSNFTDQLTVAYRLNWRYTSFANLNTSLRFLEFEQSGPGFAYVPFDPANPPPNYTYITDDGIAVVPLNSGQQGQQYVFNIGTGFDLTDHLSVGINYSLVYRHLEQEFAVDTGNGTVPFGNYITQFVLLSLSYRF